MQANLTVLGRGGFAPLVEGQRGRLDLHAVDLRQANLGGAHLEGALADEHTAWPEDFDWQAAGVIGPGEHTAANEP